MNQQIDYDRVSLLLALLNSTVQILIDKDGEPALIQQSDVQGKDRQEVIDAILKEMQVKKSVVQTII